MAMRVKGGRSEDQDRCVDEKRKKKRNSRIEDRKANGGGFFGLARPDRERQHYARMQIEIVGHDRRAKNSERDIEHARICEELAARQECRGNGCHVGPGEYKLDCKTGSDQNEERDDKSFELAKAEVHEGKDEQRIERGQHNPGTERQASEELEANCG